MPRFRSAPPAAVAAVAAGVLLAAAVLAPVRVSAEVRQIVRVDAVSALAHLGAGEWGLTGLGRARLQMLSTGNRFVRGELTLDAVTGGVETGFGTVEGGIDASDTRLSVSRAYAKVRFPLGEDAFWNATAGKTRLTWGDGSFFNAGDLLFGAVARNPDLTSDTIRDETAWLLAAFVPLGRFSFVEPVVLPPEPDFSEPGETYPPLSRTAAGGRFQTKIGQVKAEAGYLYRGEENVHRPYLSLQGNLFADLYGAVSAGIPGTGADAGAVLDLLAVSFGLLHIQTLESGDTLSFRLEGLVRPGGRWSEGNDPQAEYGLTLFPEIVWSPSPSFSVYLRSLASPLDLSAVVIPGFAWRLYDGFTFSTFTMLQAGEETDVYGWNRPGGVVLTTTVSFVY